MINNLCETPWWSLWWHLILRPIYLLWCKTRYHLGPFHGDVRKVPHYFGLNVSKVLFNHPAMYWSVNWGSIIHALMHFDMCIHLYIRILTDLKVFPKSYFSLLAPSIFPRKKCFFLFVHHFNTWVSTAAAVFSGRDVVCLSLLMKQKRFYAVAAVRAMRMFKLPCSNLRFGVTGCMLDLTFDLGWERSHFPFAFKSCLVPISVFFISKHPNVIFGEVAPTFFGCVSVNIFTMSPKQKNPPFLLGTLPPLGSTEESPSPSRVFFEVIFLGANGL